MCALSAASALERPLGPISPVARRPAGTRVSIWNGSTYDDFDYVNGAWVPPLPLLALGQSAFVSLLVNTNCCELEVLCASNKVVDCEQPWSFDPPTVLTNCCTNVTVTVLNTVTNGFCPLLVERTWEVTDCNTNSVTCTQIVTATVSGASIPPVIVSQYYDAATGMHITIQTHPCYTYVLECKDRLLDPWSTCQTVVGTGTNHEFIDPLPLPTTRFYRVRLLCP